MARGPGGLQHPPVAWAAGGNSKKGYQFIKHTHPKPLNSFDDVYNLKAMICLDGCLFLNLDLTPQ